MYQCCRKYVCPQNKGQTQVNLLSHHPGFSLATACSKSCLTQIPSLAAPICLVHPVWPDLLSSSNDLHSCLCFIHWLCFIVPVRRSYYLMIVTLSELYNQHNSVYLHWEGEIMAQYIISNESVIKDLQDSSKACVFFSCHMSLMLFFLIPSLLVHLSVHRRLWLHSFWSILDISLPVNQRSSLLLQITPKCQNCHTLSHHQSVGDESERQVNKRVRQLFVLKLGPARIWHRGVRCHW